MSFTTRFSLPAALAQLPPLPTAHSVENSPWWALPGMPTLAPLRAVRSPDLLVVDLDRLFTRLEWLALLASIAEESVRTGLVPVDRLELLRFRIDQSSAAAGDAVAVSPPADYDSSTIAMHLWGHGPWRHWDVALETACLAGRTLRADGRFNRDVTAVVWGLLLRDVAWEVISRRPQSAGREKLVPGHGAMGAALVQGTFSLPRLVSQVIADHHQFGRAMGAMVRESYPRRGNLSLAAAAFTRLVDVESALLSSGKSGAIIRRAALEHLQRETLSGTWDQEWVRDLAGLLADSSSRERIVLQATPHDAVRGDTYSIHSAEASPAAPHTGSHLPVGGAAHRGQPEVQRPVGQHLSQRRGAGREVGR